MKDMQGFQLIMNFLIMPIFFFSGALFPLDNVPTAIKVVAYINPLAYGVDGIRASLTGISHMEIILDLIVMIAITIPLFAIGSYFFSKIEI